jgi:N-acetylmuramic acid 6-phosphate (MurNAc-6-P) etherase
MGFADTGLGKVSAAQTLTVQAAQGTTIGAASVTGEASEFRLTTDDCKGAVLAAGQTCTVTRTRRRSPFRTPRTVTMSCRSTSPVSSRPAAATPK